MPEPLNFGALNALNERLATTRESTRKILSGAASRMQSAMQAYDTQADVLTKQQDKVAREADATLGNIERIAGNPFADLIGLFDKDYNRDVQAVKLERAQLGLETIGTRMKVAQNRLSSSFDIINKQTTTANSLLKLDRDGLLDTQSLIEFGFEVEENIHASTVRNIQGADTATLRAWMANPQSAGGQVATNPGLIRAELMSRMASDLNLQAGEVALASNKLSLQRNAREEAMSGLTDAELLGELGAPSGRFARGHLTAELMRREERLDSQRSMKLAIAADEMNLANSIKERMLVQETSELELRHMLAAAGANNGVLNLDGVQLKQEEIRKALTAKQSLALDEQLRYDEIISAGLGANAVATEVASSVQAIHNLHNPGVPLDPANPTVGLPDDVAAEVLRYAELVQAAEMAGSPTALVAANEQMRDKLQARKDEIVKSYPKAEQGAVREFMNNSDMPRVTSAVHAGMYLANNVSNPLALATDPLWNSVWRDFSNAYNETKQASKGMAIEDMDINLGEALIAKMLAGDEKEQDKAMLLQMEEAIQATGMREKARGKLYEQHVINTLNTLTETSPDVWGGIYNPDRGRFAREAYQVVIDEETEQSQSMFSITKLNTLLATRTQRLQEEGVLDQDQNLAEVLYEKMQANIGQINGMAGNDITKSALNKLLFNNRPDVAVMEVLEYAMQPAEQVYAQDVAAGERQRVEQVLQLERDAQRVLARPGPKVQKGLAQEQMETANALRNDLSPAAVELLNVLRRGSQTNVSATQ